MKKTNEKTVLAAIRPHLNQKCLEMLEDYSTNSIVADAAMTAWMDDVQDDLPCGRASLEIGARYSNTGNPVVVNFIIENAEEIMSALHEDAEIIPNPIYSYN